MEFAGKVIVSAAVVVNLALIYRFYKLRAATPGRAVADSGDPEITESGEQTNRDTGQGLQPWLSLQREENAGNPAGYGDQCLNKAELKRRTVDRASDGCEQGSEHLQDAASGRGMVRTHKLKVKFRRPLRKHLVRKGLTEGQDKAPTQIASGHREWVDTSYPAEQYDRPKLNNTSSAWASGISCEGDTTDAKQNRFINTSSPTCCSRELYVRINGEPQSHSSFDVPSAVNGTHKGNLSAGLIEDPHTSPPSDLISDTPGTAMGNQPSELPGNQIHENVTFRQGTAGGSRAQENPSSVCELHPDSGIGRSSPLHVSPTCQDKREKVKIGNGSETGLNVPQLRGEVNLSDHKIISPSEMETEWKACGDRSNSCSDTQITQEPASLDVDHLKTPASQCKRRGQHSVCPTGVTQDNIVFSQSLTIRTEVVNSSESDFSPSEYREASDISSEVPCSSIKSAITTIKEGRTVLRKGSISAIAETPAFLIEFDSETRECWEKNHSNELNSRAPSVDDISSSSLGSLVDSLYLSQPDLSKETPVEVIARANFIHIPLNNQSTVEVMKCRLALENCYEILCVAKKHNLKDLQDAAYQVMSDNYLQVLKNPNIYGQLKADERELILMRRMSGRTYLMVANVDVKENYWAKAIVQTNTEDQTSARPPKPPQTKHTVYYYKEEHDSWYPLVNIAVESISKDCALCTMYNYLFVVAGCRRSGKEIKLSNKVFCYNPVTNIWSEICPLNQARPNCKLVALDGYLYAIGGECLSTVERYDPRTDRWIFIAPLPQGTFSMTYKATVCNGEIYVTRGTFYYQLLKYNAKEDTWNVCSMMSMKDKTTDIAAIKNFIYRFEINQQHGISVYQYHVITKTGYECATKRHCKLAPFQCAVMDDTIYCINKHFMVQFVAHELSPYFRAEDYTAVPEAKGVLFPFVLTLPERVSPQTRV
ncbi:uncharacterized protein klhdc7a isoform X2 [Stegostoma tigrinum]|uniref:uncharacterized protein klhdc7a isoform X2 n=1 Tax=Stegostoma tigrinum TaxID=3053191 RepID=UPI00287083DF|nr:uncharacterized protein klhdc7a isoform X2 [Stegostoma tigrinum]